MVWDNTIDKYLLSIVIAFRQQIGNHRSQTHRQPGEKPMPSHETVFGKVLWQSWWRCHKAVASAMLIGFSVALALRGLNPLGTAVDETLRVVDGVNLAPLDKMLIGLLLASVAFSLVNWRPTRRLGYTISKRIEDFTTTSGGLICGLLGGLAAYELGVGLVCPSCGGDANAVPVLLRVLTVWLQLSGLLLLLAAIRHCPILFYGPPDSHG